MAQVVPNTSPSSVMLSPDAPYSQYLRALKIEENDYYLEHVLQSARAELDGLRDIPRSRRPLTSNSWFAAIVDIRPGQDGNDVVVVARLDKAQIQGDHLGTINFGVADDFLNSLRTCAVDVHTRVVILQDSVKSMSEDDRAIEALVNSHLLGFELDLAPAYVCQLSLRKRGWGLSHMHMYQIPGLKDKFVNFEMSHGQSDNVALHLGRRTFGDGSPYTGKIVWISHRRLLRADVFIPHSCRKPPKSRP